VLDRDFDVVNFHNISLIGGPGILPMSRAPVTLYTLHEHWLLCPTHIFWKNRQQACERPECFTCCLRSGVPPQLWRYTDLIPRSLAHVDALLAPSEFTAQQHRAAGLTTPINVLPTFSNLEPECVVRHVSGDRPRFLFVGRLTTSKGIGLLLEEFAQLPEFDLHVIGDGELRQLLQTQYAGYPHIHFLGSVPQHQLVGAYQSATGLILPSLAPEVFPLTVLEALACGTPAVVHDAGGNREAIEKTGGGFVYRSGEELRHILSRLAQDTTLRETLAQRARMGYEQFYSREHYMVRYLGLIDAVGKKKRAVGGIVDVVGR
jgi:glycosyltransferase involved in cell wall biosynthesis